MSDEEQNYDEKPIDMELRTAQYIKLRDLKEAIVERHKDELKPINEAMDGLKEVLKQGMDSLNVDSVKTACGTVSFTTKSTASIADKVTFWTHVITTGNFDLLDYKANVTAVRDYIEQNQGNPVPGVNYSSYRDVGVRRKS